MSVAILIIASYLIGSIPFGVIVGRARGVDIRKHGSGNIGASNVLRLLGPGPAAAVFAGDVLKGVIPVVAGRVLLGGGLAPAQHHADVWLLGIALAAILGHTFSAFLGLRGGRAVATTLGTLLGMSWQAGLVGFGIWVVVVAATRYISVASIIASAAVPIYLGVTGAGTAHTVFWAAIAALIVARHIPNMRRLMSGTEAKIGQMVELDAGDRG